MNTSKNVVIIPQTLGAVGATSSNNSNLLANPRMLKKSKSMSNLTKCLLGVGGVVGVVVLANEGLGDFTNADTCYKGKFSISNGVKYLLTPTLEQRKALFEKVSGILKSFGDVDKLTEEQSSHIQAGPECNKAKALEEAVTRLDFCDRDFMVKKASKEKIAFTDIANGYVVYHKDGEAAVKFGADSIVLDGTGPAKRNGVKVAVRSKITYTMNKDGSLAFEAINAGDDGSISCKCTFTPNQKIEKPKK